LADDSISDVIIEIDETVGSIKATVDNLFKCVIGEPMDAETNQENDKCFLTNIVTDGRQVIIDVQDGLHEVCHDLEFDEDACGVLHD